MKSNGFKLAILFLLVVMVFAAVRVFPAASTTVSAAPGTEGVDPTAIQRAKDGGAKVSIAPQTAGVNFMILGKEQSMQSTASLRLLDPTAQAVAYLQANRGLFGITSAGEELALTANQVDTLGARHLSYKQTYQGLPVFGAEMKVHFNKAGQITVINGLFVPQITVDTTPTVAADAAGQTALHSVKKDGISVQQSTLLVYRDGLIQGIPGENHLAYEVEVGDGKDSRDFVYVDAHSGKVLNTIEGVVNIDRWVYQFNPAAPTTPTLIWKDGDPAYTGGDPEVVSMIETSGTIYDMIKNISGGTFISFDGNDAPMISMVDYVATNYCPNASWNGQYIRACDGLAIDDVIAHEWGHAYTDGTHDLIYQWQPGALNEAYSDIFGEMVDLINGAGKDTPDVVRTTSTCAEESAIITEFKINSPAGLAGYYPVGVGTFGPSPATPITQDVVLADDGISGAGATPGTVNDGCELFNNNVSGKIAMVERGYCNFAVKVLNAQKAGAVAVIVYNNTVNGESIGNMGGTAAEPITIPSVLVQRSLGLNIIANLAGGVNTTMSMYSGADGGELVDTVRWLMGEDSPTGVLRDMWDPTCAGNPGKISDPEYFCYASDNGGVHYNSGVPNRAFSLLVDGGTYNGQTVAPIGLTRAAAIYWRAQSFYQGSSTDFAGHADALETSCNDLIDAEIYDLETGAPVDAADEITAAHCDQVKKAMLAVEMRTPPTQCGFEPMLAPDAPETCGAGTTLLTTFEDTFEGADKGWTVDHQIVSGVTVNYDMPDWEVLDQLPQGRAGKAYYGINSASYGACTAIDDQSSVRRLISPEITVPNTVSFKLAFDHYMATEAGWDGGNLWIQVNGGTWIPVDYTDFTFNGYNALLEPANGGNTNPLAGLPAFSGTNPGSVLGSWGTSMVDLTDYVEPKDTVKLAFYLGQDGCGGNDGWYVDDVTLYSCTALNYFPVIFGQ